MLTFCLSQENENLDFLVQVQVFAVKVCSTLSVRAQCTQWPIFSSNIWNFGADLITKATLTHEATICSTSDLWISSVPKRSSHRKQPSQVLEWSGELMVPGQRHRMKQFYTAPETSGKLSILAFYTWEEQSVPELLQCNRQFFAALAPSEELTIPAFESAEDHPVPELRWRQKWLCVVHETSKQNVSREAWSHSISALTVTWTIMHGTQMWCMALKFDAGSRSCKVHFFVPRSLKMRSIPCVLVHTDRSTLMRRKEGTISWKKCKPACIKQQLKGREAKQLKEEHVSLLALRIHCSCVIRRQLWGGNRTDTKQIDRNDISRLPNKVLNWPLDGKYLIAKKQYKEMKALANSLTFPMRKQSNYFQCDNSDATNAKLPMRYFQCEKTKQNNESAGKFLDISNATKEQQLTALAEEYWRFDMICLNVSQLSEKKFFFLDVLECISLIRLWAFKDRWHSLSWRLCKSLMSFVLRISFHVYFDVH